MQTLSEADRMLHAFEEYYGLEYTGRMRSDLRRHIGAPPKEYLLALYQQTIEQVEARWGKLPDMAAIMRVQQQLPEAFTYSAEYEQPALTDDSGVDLDDIKVRIAERAKKEGEQNHVERERIRKRVERGYATPEERFWIACIDEYEGDWRQAVAGEARKPRQEALG